RRHPPRPGHRNRPGGRAPDPDQPARPGIRPMLTLQELVADNADSINFKWVAGEQAAGQPISNNLGRPGADLVGHLNLIHPSRVQVLGAEELAYYNNFD